MTAPRIEATSASSGCSTLARAWLRFTLRCMPAGSIKWNRILDRAAQSATVRVSSEGIDYIFPVPLSDIGDATLLATDKAMMFMSYIRKALEEGTFVKAG